MLLALVPIVASAAIAFSGEQPAQPSPTWTSVAHTAGSVSSRFNAVGRPPADSSPRVFDIERPSGIVPRPDFRPLAAGAPQTITVEVFPTTLMANSGATATITATVYDITGAVVEGAILTGSITPGRGTVGSFAPTDLSGTATSTWTAIDGSTVGDGTIQVLTDTISGTASVVVAAGPPFTVTLTAYPTELSVGATSTLTATVVDQNGIPVNDGTAVDFATDRGTVQPSGTTTNGIATSSLNSTSAGTAHITATSGGRSGSAIVVFNAGPPATLALSPATALITAGTRIAYTAIATDTYGNRIGDVTAGTSFSISPTFGGAFVVNAITPTLKGTYTVTGMNGAAVATASLVVTPSTFSRLSIETAPNGTGTPINAYAMTVYDTLTAYAVARDDYGNAINSPAASWGGTGVVGGRLNPTANSISTTFTAAVSGTGTITATSDGKNDATGLITVQAPVLRISKTDSPDPVTPGTQLRYTLRYTNTSPFAAQGVIITETYPLNTTYSHAYPPPISASNNVWSIPSLAANTSEIIDVYVNVAPQMPVGSVLTNTVRIGASRAATAIYTATTQVNASPIINVDVADTIDPVRPGQEFVYNILYSNTGNAPATGLRITETYPSQVTFLSARPSPIGGTNNVWVTNTLGVGGTSLIAVTVRVNSPVADETLMNNRVAIDSNETAPSTVTESTRVGAPMLHLTKSANPAAPAANSLLTYTLRYTNSGTSNVSYASNVVVTDALPLNTVFQSCTSGCSRNDNIVTWNRGQVPEQSSSALTLVVRVNNSLPNGTILANTARIASTELAEAFATLNNTVSSAPNVRLTKSDGVASAGAGDVLTYRLAYTNTGTAPAQNVVITDRIPANVSFVDCTACTSLGGGVYSFARGTVNAAQDGVVTLRVRVNSPLPAGVRAITNTATIRTSTSGDNPADNSAQDVDGISTVPVVTFTAAYDAKTPYPGKTITYTLRYTNTSLMNTTGVVISTTRLPSVSVIPTGWTFSGGYDTYTVGNLAAGQDGTVRYVVVLTSTFTPATSAFANTFLIHDSGPGGLPMASQNVTTMVGVPDLRITSVSVPAAVSPGQKFTATLVISNAGPGKACNPSNCGGFYVDTFVDPAAPPPSYPYVADGYPFAVVPSVAAGSTVTVLIANLSFTTAQQPKLYFKIDNFDCSPPNGADPCLPSRSLGGLVPEYNESNNVAGPIKVPRFVVFMPLVQNRRP